MYKKLKSYTYTEEQMREMWREEYCDSSKPIFTFDGILVDFHESMFDHAFYESYNRKAKDKSVLSLARLERMFWIKDTLCDSTAILKNGWDRDSKSYCDDRRVAIIKENYIVIIRFIGFKKAKFVTAYEVTDDNNLQKILDSPNWNSDGRYV